MRPSFIAALLNLAAIASAIPHPLSTSDLLSEFPAPERRDVGEDAVARRWGGLGIERAGLAARGLTEFSNDSGSLLARAAANPKVIGASTLASTATCQKTTDCRGLVSLPANSHNRCYRGLCTFGCNSRYTLSDDGTGCVVDATSSTSQVFADVPTTTNAPSSTSQTVTRTTTTSSEPQASATGQPCQKTVDCRIYDFPDFAHGSCSNGGCTFACDTGYSMNSARTGCVLSPSTTTTTTSPAATSTAAKTYKGEATYYTQNGQAGACGLKFPDSALIVAMDTRMYGDENAVSKYCGEKVHITNTDNGKTVVATIRDACPTCASSGSLDLSVAAFETIGLLDTGVLPITWYFVDVD